MKIDKMQIIIIVLLIIAILLLLLCLFFSDNGLAGVTAVGGGIVGNLWLN